MLPLSGEKRQILLDTIDFIRNDLLEVERGIRSLYEHIKWVKNEMEEVFTAENPEHRLEEVGDVIMILLRLSCFKNPKMSSEEILGIYESQPSFLRYVEQLGVDGLRSMNAKFTSRYGFLLDPKVQEVLFPEGTTQWKWLQEVMRRMFAAEKSKEPGKSPESERFFSSEIPALSDMEKGRCEALGIPDDPTVRKYALWICERLPSALENNRLEHFFGVLESGRLRDERFMRMVFLDYVHTDDLVGALGRILMLLGTESEIYAFLQDIAGIEDDRFIEEFLILVDNRASMIHFREYFAAYQFFRSQGFGRDSLSEADTLVIQFMIFDETEAGYDLLDCIRTLEQDEKLRQIEDMNIKSVTILAMVHRYRRANGVYDAVTRYGYDVSRLVNPYLRVTNAEIS